ncbi:MAG: hypothetical protein K0R05_1012 [Anaerocolumna sp.]|nr:hypothetical protein [Anaerocolumna sp.]
MQNKNRIMTLLLSIIIICFMGIVLSNMLKEKFDYMRYETSTRTYNKAKVLSIEDQKLELEGSGEYLTGTQALVVQFLSGKEKGKKVEVTNYLTANHNIMAKSGQILIICSDIPENAEGYYTVYNYYRSASVWLIVAVFLALITAIGGLKGLRSSLSLIFTLFMVICFLLPALYRGENPIAAAIISSAISAAVALFLLNGISYNTLFDIMSTTLGVVISGIFFLVISKILIISGYQADESEALLLISQSTGLHIKDVLYAGVLTASLGAVMDLAVSIRASILEIYLMNPKISGKALFLSGMNIGRDMIGTMTNTLILAFAGSSLMTLLVFISYGVQYEQLMSSDYLALEIGQAIAGSAAVALMVPITSFICATGFCVLSGRKQRF